jgi:hypothetical protein
MNLKLLGLALRANLAAPSEPGVSTMTECVTELQRETGKKPNFMGAARRRAETRHEQGRAT